MTQIDRRQFLARGAVAAAGLGFAVAAGGGAAGAVSARSTGGPVTSARDWWQLPIRSGRPWASGVTYWSYDSLNDYERQVALLDGGGGASRDGRTDTWEMLAGGPVRDPGTITRRSHLDWSEPGATNFGAVFDYLPPAAAWFCWVFPTVPETEAARGPLTGPDSVWRRVRRGDYDEHYRAMGARIRRNLDRKGVPLERFIGRPNHEMNQSNAYQVFPATRADYRAAMERTIDLLREGADYSLHMAHAPALGKRIGTYLDWCPSNCDVLSISYHPSNT